MTTQNGSFSIHSNKIKWVLILSITIMWGYAWVLMKEVLEFMGPFTFSSLRFFIGSVTLFIVMWMMKIGLPERRFWKPLIIVGLLQTTVVYVFVMYGLLFVDAGKSSVLLYSMPLWSSLLAVKFLGEKLTRQKYIGLILGMVGLLTILGWDIWIGQRKEVVFGEVLMILAAIAWGFANNIYRLHLEEMSKIQATAYQMAFGTVGIMFAALLMEWNEPIYINAQSIYYLLFTGVITSALCFTGWFILLSMIDMVTATMSTLLVPVFGLFFGSLLLDEQITVGIWIGTGLILFGISYAQWNQKEGRRKHHNA